MPRTKEKIVAKFGRGETFIDHVFIGGLIKVTTGLIDHEIDLKCRTCTCRSWKMFGLPCDHACVVIRRVGGQVANYVDDWFKFNIQKMIYLNLLY